MVIIYFYVINSANSIACVTIIWGYILGILYIIYILLAIAFVGDRDITKNYYKMRYKPSKINIENLFC